MRIMTTSTVVICWSHWWTWLLFHSKGRIFVFLHQKQHWTVSWAVNRAESYFSWLAHLKGKHNFSMGYYTCFIEKRIGSGITISRLFVLLGCFLAGVFFEVVFGFVCFGFGFYLFKGSDKASISKAVPDLKCNTK